MLEIDVRIERVGMDRRHQHPVPHLQQHLGQAGDAGRAFQMADIRFRRADRAVLVFALCEGLGQPRNLDRITEARAGAVRFDVADMPRIDAGNVQGFLDQRRLAPGAGDRESRRLAAVIDGGAADDAVDVIAVAARAGQRLQHHRAHAFARHIAGTVRAERAAAPVLRQHVHVREQVVLVRMQRQIDRAGDGDIDLALSQRLAGQMDRGQRRRARGVHGHAGAGEIELIGNAIGDRPITGVRCDPGVARAVHAMQLVIAPHDTDVHADRMFAIPASGGERRGRIAGVLDRMGGDFQQQPLVGVEIFRFHRRDVEEHRVEAIDIAQESAPIRVGMCPRGLAGTETELRGDVGAFFGNFLDAIATETEVLPERFQRFGLRIAPGEADDHDRVVRRHRNPVRSERERGRTRALRGRDAGHDGCGSNGGHRRPVEQVRERGIVLLVEIAAQLAERRILEEQGLRQRAEGFFQQRDQFDHHHRIDAVILEGLVRIEFGRHPQLVREKPGEIRRHGRRFNQRTLGNGFDLDGLRDLHGRHDRGRGNGLDWRRNHDSHRFAHMRGIARHHDQLRLRLRQTEFERIQTGLVFQRNDTETAAHGCDFGFAHAHAAVAPERPVDRQRPAVSLAARTGLLAPVRERILECIAVGVIALADIAHHTCDRGKHHEHVERFVARFLIEIRCADGFGREHPRKILGRFQQQEAVLDHPGGMQHAVQTTAIRVDRRDGLPHLVAMGGIAGQIGHRTTVRAQRGHDVPLPVRQRGAAGQIHVAAIACAYMPGDDAADATKTASDQIRPALAECGRACAGFDPRGNRGVAEHFAHGPGGIVRTCDVADAGRVASVQEFIGDDLREAVLKVVGGCTGEHSSGERRLFDAQGFEEAIQRDVFRCVARLRCQLHETSRFGAAQHGLHQREDVAGGHRDACVGIDSGRPGRHQQDAFETHSPRPQRCDSSFVACEHFGINNEGIGSALRRFPAAGGQYDPFEPRGRETRRCAQSRFELVDVIRYAYQHYLVERCARWRSVGVLPMRTIQTVGKRGGHLDGIVQCRGRDFALRILERSVVDARIRQPETVTRERIGRQLQALRLRALEHHRPRYIAAIEEQLCESLQRCVGVFLFPVFPPREQRLGLCAHRIADFGLERRDGIRRHRRPQRSAQRIRIIDHTGEAVAQMVALQQQGARNLRERMLSAIGVKPRQQIIATALQRICGAG